ncbi:MAG: TrkH family potassium uptake protein [Kiritimatiellia bacterium]
MKADSKKRSVLFIGIISVAAFVLLLFENTIFGLRWASAFRVANLAVWTIYIVDVLWCFRSAPDKTVHLRGHWYEAIVFVPVIQYFVGAEHGSLYTITRQIVIVAMLLSRISRIRGLLSLLALKPAQLMLMGFSGAIGVGTVLLMLPAATVSGARMPLVDALFTATSAVCVTGLIVQDTATYFSAFGQAVVLALIQVGGLGIMTFSVALVALLRKRMDLRQRVMMQGALDHDTVSGVRGMVRFIVLMTLWFEVAGALLLFVSWHGRLESLPSAVWHSLFHSVSAFCNAGFSTFSDSISGFRDSPAVNAVIAALIVSGGLGFPVIRDFQCRLRHSAEGNRKARLRVQTKTVLTVSVTLILGGAALIYLKERTGLLGDMSTADAIMASVFQSVTARTAGFNTVDIGSFSPAVLLVIIALMFIGASPGSTGGGIKTTTVAALWAAIAASLRNRPHVELYRRTLQSATVYRALAVLCISLLLVTAFACALLCTEDAPFTDVLFETVSAFGTVGLSTGLTPHLSRAGRLLIVLLMFIGRLGPLTIAYAMLPARAPVRYKYAEERMMIG